MRMANVSNHITTQRRHERTFVSIGPTTSPMIVAGENIVLSNSGTIVPGEKEPRDPPRALDGQVENSLAREANESPAAILSRTPSASTFDFTNM